VPPPASQTVEDPPRPPPTVVIALHFGWDYTHVGWIPPNETSAELLFPPIPCLIGLNGDESEVLYGLQIYEALRKWLPSPDATETAFSWLNLKSMLRDKEVKWRKDKGKVNSELPLAMFHIHVKTKIEAEIPLPSSSTKYKVIMVLPQVLSIVQRGRIYDATELAGFGEDQVHFIKETTAAALAFAHDADIWSPGFVLPLLVCCPSPDVQLDDSDADNEIYNADVAIFSKEDGILTVEESAGRQGLSQKELLQEMTKFKGMIVPFEGMINKKSVFVHLDDGSYEEEMPLCSRPGEMQEFRALLGQLRAECIERSSTSGNDLLNKIREHLTKYTVLVRNSLAFNYFKTVSVPI
jgi:hypothetical protein